MAENVNENYRHRAPSAIKYLPWALGMTTVGIKNGDCRAARLALVRRAIIQAWAAAGTNILLISNQDACILIAAPSLFTAHTIHFHAMTGSSCFAARAFLR